MVGLQFADEFVEKEFGVGRTAGCLRVELRREERLALVADSLVGIIVHIYEKRLPIGSECVVVHCESVVLGCYETSVGPNHPDRLVVAPVAVF